jgi:pyruvate/2-oxoglutarate/acetoin dehydrogenase E1 component
MREISYSMALKEAIREEMKRDDNIFIAGEDVGVYGGDFGITQGIQKEFGVKRCFDTPVTEIAIAGLAGGSAAMGLRPIVEFMFIDFTTCAMDQIVNQMAKMRYMFGGILKMPIVMRTHMGSGFNAAAQHGQSLEAWFAHVPGLKVIAPSSPYDAKGLLKSAIRDDNPVMFLEHIYLYDMKGPVPEEEYTIPIGKAEVKAEGEDVTIITYSKMVKVALEASNKLRTEGITAEVLDLRTISPLDEKAIFSSAKKTGRVIVVQEAPKTCGVAAEISALIIENCFDKLKSPIKRIAAYDTPIPFSPPLEKFYLPNVEDVILGVKEIL